MPSLFFYVDVLEEGSAAQQVLDRLLFGWPERGRFAEAPWGNILLPDHLNGSAVERRLRATDKLSLISQNKGLPEGCAAWIVAPGKPDHWDVKLNQAWYEALSKCSQPGWVIGLPPRPWCDEALPQTPRFQAGTALPWTWRLPEVDLPNQCPLEEVMVLIRGPYHQAEKQAVDALLSLIGHRRGGESGIDSVRLLQGDKVWQGARDGLFAWDLFKAAISRSHSKQGDAKIDGRTQDIVGLGMVPSLARDTRAWIIHHVDGLQSVIISVDGIINDDTFAARSKDGGIFSAQFYQPPRPSDHRFSRLTSTIVRSLDGTQSSPPPQRHLLWIDLIDCMDSMMSGMISKKSWEHPHKPYHCSHSLWQSES